MTNLPALECTDLGLAVASREYFAECFGVYRSEGFDVAEAAWRACEHYVAALTRPSSPISGDAVEDLDLAVALIQEAKGADGPTGGFVTNHLDAAESHLDKVRAALTALRGDGDAVEPKPVAWSYEYRDDYKGVETGWHTRLSLTPVRSCAANAAYVRNVVPLYATPPSPASSTDVAGLAGQLRASAKDFERPPSVQSTANVRAINAMNQAADILDRLNQPSPPPTGSEREKIVAWLRRELADYRSRKRVSEGDTERQYRMGQQDATVFAIAAIERGEHLATPTQSSVDGDAKLREALDVDALAARTLIHFRRKDGLTCYANADNEARERRYMVETFREVVLPALASPAPVDSRRMGK